MSGNYFMTDFKEKHELNMSPHDEGNVVSISLKTRKPIISDREDIWLVILTQA